MKYIKVILTVIALLLALNLFRGMIVPEARATAPANVNISHVGGATVFRGLLPVEIKE